jgi:uncharacterized protein with PIN domain
MSMVICEDCDAPINSDDDPGCFVETGNMRRLHEETVLCENCRERRWDRQQERLMEDGPGPSLLDQQIAAMRFK